MARAVSAEGSARRAVRRRPTGDQLYSPHAEVRLSLGRCAGGLSPAQDALQSLRALGGQGRLGEYLPRLGYGQRKGGTARRSVAHATDGPQKSMR